MSTQIALLKGIKRKLGAVLLPQRAWIAKEQVCEHHRVGKSICSYAGESAPGGCTHGVYLASQRPVLVVHCGGIRQHLDGGWPRVRACDTRKYHCGFTHIGINQFALGALPFPLKRRPFGAVRIRFHLIEWGINRACPSAHRTSNVHSIDRRG